jgi:hypothetical protein
MAVNHQPLPAATNIATAPSRERGPGHGRKLALV